MSSFLVDFGLLLEQLLSGAMSFEEFQATCLDRLKNEGQLAGHCLNCLTRSLAMGTRSPQTHSC
jgi:hypothetical protein